MQITSNRAVDAIKEQVGLVGDDSAVKVKMVNGKPVLAKGYGLHRGGIFFMGTDGRLRIGGRAIDGANRCVVPGFGVSNEINELSLIYIDYTSGVKDFGYICGGAYFILMNDGVLYTWGLNDYGSLGLGPLAPNPVIVPTRVLGPNGEEWLWDKVSVAETFSFHTSRAGFCMRKKDTDEWYFVGDNTSAMFTTNAPAGKVVSPTLIENPEGETIIDIRMVVQADGNMFCFTESGNIYGRGRNTDGSLGVGSVPAGNVLTWTKVLGLPPLTKDMFNEITFAPTNGYANPSAVATGSATAVLIDGSVYTTGSAVYNMNGGSVTKSEFSILPELSNVVKLSKPTTSLQSMLALDANGNLYGWGWNGSGGLAQNHYNAVEVPRLVAENVEDFWINTASAPLDYYLTLIVKINGKFYTSGEHGRGSAYLKEDPFASSNDAGRYDRLKETLWHEFTHNVVDFSIVSEYNVLGRRGIFAFTDKGDIFTLGDGNMFANGINMITSGIYDTAFTQPHPYF